MIIKTYEQFDLEDFSEEELFGIEEKTKSRIR